MQLLFGSSLEMLHLELVRTAGIEPALPVAVALARKLLIALWRYTTAGVVIEGAVMKATPATI